MRLKILFLPILAWSALLSFAEGPDGGLVSGQGWGILLSAPAGWTWDRQSFRPKGIEALFLKEGERYSDSGLSISVRPVEKRAGGPAGLAAFMEEEREATAAPGQDRVVRELAAHSPGMGYGFPMREVDGGGRFLLVAYYEGEKAFFSFVLSCGSPEERERERTALLEILDSFVYLSRE